MQPGTPALAARGTGIVTGNDTGAGDSEFIMFSYNERSILGYVVVPQPSSIAAK
jgi:hypothetical protein